MKLQGIVATPVTPFSDDGEVDHQTLDRLINFVINNNAADALALPMHCGESPNMSLAERKAVTETAIQAVDGRIPVLIHASAAATHHVIELAQHAEASGASGVVVVTPYHWRPDDAALLNHYQTIARSIGIGVVAYQFPDKFGVGLSPKVLSTLIDTCPNFIGLKDAGYKSDYIIETCRISAEAGDRFSLFSGVEYVLPALALGADGCFSPTGQVAPRLVRNLVDACLRGDASAREYQYRMGLLLTAFRKRYPAGFKSALAMMGRPVGVTRLPLLPLTPEEEASLKSVMDANRVFADEPMGW